jgi:hypothetical protein
MTSRRKSKKRFKLKNINRTRPIPQVVPSLPYTFLPPPPPIPSKSKRKWLLWIVAVLTFILAVFANYLKVLDGVKTRFGTPSIEYINKSSAIHRNDYLPANKFGLMLSGYLHNSGSKDLSIDNVTGYLKDGTGAKVESEIFTMMQDTLKIHSYDYKTKGLITNMLKLDITRLKVVRSGEDAVCQINLVVTGDMNDLRGTNTYKLVLNIEDPKGRKYNTESNIDFSNSEVNPNWVLPKQSVEVQTDK